MERILISHGLIWFDRMEDGKWTIKSINGAIQENFNNKKLIGWETKKGIIPQLVSYIWLF